MQTMTNHQVMAIAPSDIHYQYFSEVLDLINAQTRNKHLCLHVENEELALHMQNLRDKEEYMHEDLGSVSELEEHNCALKFSALPYYIFFKMT